MRSYIPLRTSLLNLIPTTSPSQPRCLTASKLATVVVRIGGEGASALRVVGFGNASLDEVGGARAFASCLWHETAVQGGLKVAFFVGYAFPHVDERRMRRFQDPWNVVKDVD